MKNLLVALLCISLKGFAQFTPGNLVIYRVGDGNIPLSTAAAPVFLDEYTPAGVFVKSIAMPVKASGANKPFVASGSAFSEGLINRSADKKFLILTGYAKELGDSTKIASTTALAVNRVVGVVDYAGNINTTTALSNYASGSSPRSAISNDGVNLWMVGGTGGIRYATVGSTTASIVSSTPDNIRGINIFNNQLYASVATTATTRIATVGSGTPTGNGQAVTNIPGYPISGTPNQFVFFDLNAAIPGPDVLYVADEDSAVFKYSLNANNQWVSNGAIGTRFDYYRGLTGVANGTTVTLYAVRKGGTIRFATGGELVVINDASGYNGPLTATPVVVATAPANTGFRGIAFAPINVTAPIAITLPVEFTDVKALQTNNGVEISFTNPNESDVSQYIIERSADARNFMPVTTIAPFNNGKRSYSRLDKDVLSGITYYRIKGIETSGKTIYSPVISINTNNKSAGLNIYPNPVQGSQLTLNASLEKGSYLIQVFTTAGQVLFSKTISHNGGTMSQTINLPETIKKGMYTLHIKGEGVKLVKSFLAL